MKHTHVAVSAVLGLALMSTWQGVAAQAAMPNIVVILADDLGYGDVGCYGAQLINTPNIDQLAARGMLFANAYVAAPVCCPSRYALMTGTYPWRAPKHEDQQLWATHVSRCLIGARQPTIASVLKHAGYRTGMIGKWHLGLMNAEQDWNTELKPGPLECGFDYFFGDASNRFKFYIENHRVAGLGSTERIEGKGFDLEIPSSVHQIDYPANARVLSDKACEFIRNCKADQPLFLYYAPNNVHMPMTPGPDFQGTSQCGVYGDFVQELDWMVGQVVKTLKETGRLDETLIIFSSDNGPHIDLEALKAGHRSAANLLGQKTDVWEGGVHVDFIAQWPGVIEPGTESDALICLTDVSATAAQIVKADLPAGSFPDGFSLLPVFRGEGRITEDRSVVFNWGNRAKTFAIRRGEWVYIDRPGSGGVSAGDDFDQPRTAYNSYTEIGFENSDVNADGTMCKDIPSAQLYNLKADPAQKQNIIVDHPEIAETLKQQLEAVKASSK
ncbi:MAG: arylsulfatase, partial [Kiritimatiellales bacterium]|nr:arylsulfatase [Kiritimatiellales bacterium]